MGLCSRHTLEIVEDVCGIWQAKGHANFSLALSQGG